MKTITKELNLLDEQDIENALSKALGREVRLSEVDCMLNYCIPFDTFEPSGMYLVFKVEEEWIYDTDLFLDENQKYRLNGKELSLNELFLPVKEVFAFDPSAFHSFETCIDSSD